MELEEYAEYIRKAVKASLPDHLADSKVSIVYGKYWYAHLEIEIPWSDTPDGRLVPVTRNQASSPPIDENSIFI